MEIKNDKKNSTPQHPAAGFSMTEVTVAAVIFALTAVGIISTISALRTPSAASEQSVQAAYYGQNILDNLRAQVDQRIWNETDVTINPLAVGTHTLPASGGYTAVYNVTDDGTGRRVDLTITW